ncbi:MAG: TonB-dependent receptor plug domain-containing protein [Prevotella sp.]
MRKRLIAGTALIWCLAQTLTAQTILKQDTIQEVVVTGTGTQHLLKDAPVQTEVISGKMLRSYGGKSIEDILSGLTASFAFNDGDMGSQMQMNGLGNSYILILVDGKRIHGDVGGENDLSLIDPQHIEKIEIVKGASSALYGSDAIAGVVNIITKKHDEGLLLENTTRGGSYGDLRQHNGLALRWDKWSSYTNFHLQHTDGWQNTTTEHTTPFEEPINDSHRMTANRKTNWSLSERLTYQPTRHLELYAEGSYHRRGIYRPQGKYPKYDVTYYDMQYKNASAAVGGKWTKGGNLLTLDVDWNKHAYFHEFTSIVTTEGIDENGNMVLDFPFFPGQRQLQSDQQRVIAHLKGVFPLPYHNQLSAGVEYRYDWLKGPTSIEGQEADDNTEALYVQDEWQQGLGENVKMQLTGGLRLIRNEQFGWHLSPKVSAMLSLDNLRLRGTWSQGFKTPTLKEQRYRYVKEMSQIMLYLGNLDLKPQQSNYFSLGPEYTIGNLTLSATGYYNRLDDMITLVTIPKTQAPASYLSQYGETLNKVRQYKNMENARTYGVDVTASYALRQWTFGLGYSYLDTRAEVYDETTHQLQKVTIDGMAHHKGNAYATWNHRFSNRYALGVGLYGRMSTKRYYQVNGDGKGYQLWRLSTTHDLGASKRLIWRVEAGVDNIFNYVDRTDHGLHLGTNTPGTTVYASLTVRFREGKNLKNTFKSNFKNNDNEDD